MSTWTARAHELRAAQAQLLATIIREIDPDDPVLTERRYATTLAGDERKLRGIPAIGRGVAGATSGADVDDPRSSPFRPRRVVA